MRTRCRRGRYLTQRLRAYQAAPPSVTLPAAMAATTPAIRPVLLPAELLATAPEALRSAGLSRQKTGYLYNLAEHASAGLLEAGALRRASDDEAIEIVTQLKGVGRWTADMLLMFCLGRPDVLPVGDLGVQRIMAEAYRLDSRPDADAMLRIAEPWRPYRSAGAWYLWRYGDVITQENTL